MKKSIILITGIFFIVIWGCLLVETGPSFSGGSLSGTFDGTLTPPALGNQFVGIWGSSGTDVFVIGQGGAILHYDGIELTAMASGTEKGLHGIWGSSGSDVFVAGSNGVILGYNGTQWSSMTSGIESNLYEIWGSSETDVYAVGGDMEFDESLEVSIQGWILHFDGLEWGVFKSLTNIVPYGIWGSSGSDIYIVGIGVDEQDFYHEIMHYNGTEWSTVYHTEDIFLSGIWGSSATDIFVSGSKGTILHYNGYEWSAMESGTDKDLGSIWGRSGSDVYTIAVDSDFLQSSESTILHYNGIEWTAMNTTLSLALVDIWGCSQSEIFALSGLGSLLHYTGEEILAPDPDQTFSVIVTDNHTRIFSDEGFLETYVIPGDFHSLSDIIEFSADIDKSEVKVTFSFSIQNIQSAISNLSLYKLKSSGTCLPFKKTSYPDPNTDGAWWITDGQGNYMDSTGMLYEDKSYKIHFVVKDNGDYDLDDTLGAIRDPLVLGSIEEDNSTEADDAENEETDDNAGENPYGDVGVNDSNSGECFISTAARH